MKRDIKIYIAGSLFSEGDQRQRKYEHERTVERFPTATVYSPVMADFNTEKDTMLPTPLQIYEGDYLEIESSDYVLFDLGNKLDEGLNLEMGIVCGINESRMTRSIFPIGVISDIRLETANEYEIPSLGYNHMVIGAFDKFGKIVTSFEEALEEIDRIENNN